MTEHDQHSSGEEVATNMQPSQGRRRLVKGVIIAVPAIFTVRNGFARPNSIPEPTDACTSLASYNSFINSGGDPQDTQCPGGPVTQP